VGRTPQFVSGEFGPFVEALNLQLPCFYQSTMTETKMKVVKDRHEKLIGPLMASANDYDARG
jgi:hypothetical protein